MSKNLTRKGLAFGAFIALGSSVIAGAPALAVDAVTLQPTEGTSYNTFVDEEFTLEAVFTDAAQQGAENVKFKVVDSGSRLVKSGGTQATDRSGYGTSYNTTTNVLTVGADLAAHSTESYLVVTGGSTVGPTKSYLALRPSGTTTFSVTAQAWMDFDDDGIIDDGEAASPVRTVTFNAAADVKATTVVDAAALNDASITAHIKTTPALNGEQLEAGDVTATINNATRSRAMNVVSSSYDATNAEWDVTGSYELVETAGDVLQVIDNNATTANTAKATYTAHGIVTGDVITITGLGDTDANKTAVAATRVDADNFTYVVVSADVTDTTDHAATGDKIVVLVQAHNYTVTAKRSTTELASAVGTAPGAAVSASSKTTSVNTADQSYSVANDDTTIIARTGKDVSATYTVKDADGVVVSGKQVRTVVSGLNGTVKVNGTTVADGTVINSVTNASGQVAYTIDISTESASNAIVLTATAEGVSGTTNSITVDWQDASYVIVDTADTAAITDNTGVRAVAKGASATFNVAVVDQWRQAIDSAKYRLKVAAGTRTNWTKTVALSSGKASFSVEDGGLTTGDTTVTVTFQKDVSGTWTNYGADTQTEDATLAGWDGGTDEDSVITIKYYDQTDIIEVTTPSAQTRTATAVKAVDGRTSAEQAFSTTSTAVTIAGSVKNSVTLAKKLGAQVTVSGDSNILFVVGGVSAKGSISFYDADGDYSVAAYSNKVLTDSVVTITSGAASKTAKVSFTASTTAADITQVISTGSISSKAGRTSVLSFATADEFGNTVKVSAGTAVTVTNDGPGYLTSYPTAFSANGTFTTVLVTASGDAGLVSITVKADGPSNATTDDITVTKTGLVNVSATVSAGKKLATATVKNAEGLTVKVVSGTKVVTKVATSDSFKVSLTKLTAGKKTVKVYVNDVLVSSKSVTVKK